MIFFSSGGSLYGNPQRFPVLEDDPAAPLSYHGAGKLAMEAMLHAFRARGQAVTILRPSNAYGPGQMLKSGFGLKTTHHPARGVDVKSVALDTNRLEARLLWKPETSLGKGIEQMRDWLWHA
jgi:UDP-glucose 4-epimerase